ncbi:GNAT family N-acetyltransferase [Achromobacter xylosoxidans]|uniref:N-acetyltransferase n=1 Tax=Alcaligenes xylosoxydans xylosoxydans TaxID=85698 RepID=A0A424W4J2_ALCXX|nr:GNAT family N-acetyltransferase [Achromobacter xylosoxidans]MBC9908533.1 N-acetyltransferase [Achromobacter xylosoxidans]MBD0872514.1 N-acetyltransferase [Achromobacter xylosoxidans]QNP87497.1 N-acetyltransferase [Achromobacter xylosoxidans]RPJ88232.1 N-acetyltransferase [Achromobacter xylosoxidans]
MISVTHDSSLSRYTATVDGVLCVLDYQLQDHTMAITHTGVPSQVGGRGIAAALTQYALDDARARGWKVRPLCSYADAYIRRHPEYNDLLA